MPSRPILQATQNRNTTKNNHQKITMATIKTNSIGELASVTPVCVMTPSHSTVRRAANLMRQVCRNITKAIQFGNFRFVLGTCLFCCSLKATPRSSKIRRYNGCNVPNGDLPLLAPQKVLRAAMVAFEQSRQPSREAWAMSLRNLLVNRMRRPGHALSQLPRAC